MQTIMDKIYSFSGLSRSSFRRTVKQADPSIFSDLLDFLEDDPRTFGSGYLKQIIWRYIRHYTLSAQNIARLENAAMHYLYRPMCPEFKRMAQSICCIASEDFWIRIQAQLASDNPIVRLNASCLFPYSQGMRAGETMRLEWKARKRQFRQVLPSFSTMDDVLNTLKAPENWFDGEAIYREARAADLPIVYYDSRYDLEIARLDVAASNKKLMLTKLEQLLLNGNIMGANVTVRLYALYLLSQIEDAAAVTIVMRFMESKLQHKFESPSKELLQMACFKVLWHYKTAEAQISLEQEGQPRLISRVTQDKANGWLLKSHERD